LTAESLSPGGAENMGMMVHGSLDTTLDPVDNEVLSFDDDPAVGLTAAKIQPTGGRKRRRVEISLETGGVDARYWINGVDPTAAEGHLVHDGDVIELNGHNILSRFRIIGVAAGASKAMVTYYG
jgi:hypothetical protein